MIDLTYERLQLEHDCVHIAEMDLSDVSGLKGLYYNGCIAIEQGLSSNEKSCILAEELGHHYTTVGNILDQSSVSNRKQELRARMWAYNKLIGLMEKSCILAEELGHHYTTVGNILDQSSVSNRKQELRARMWAYNKLIGLMGIIKSYEHGCQSYHEMAEYLDVTEEFLWM